MSPQLQQILTALVTATIPFALVKGAAWFKGRSEAPERRSERLDKRYEAYIDRVEASLKSERERYAVELAKRDETIGQLEERVDALEAENRRLRAAQT